MRVYHLNCISSCPIGGRLMDGVSPSALQRGHLTCHCLLVETADSLVLIDTGFGLRDVADPHGRLSEFFLLQLKPDFREEMTARRQIEKLGFDADDVRHIVLSHLDFDHAGGLDDFPGAKVHMLTAEASYAKEQKTWLDRQRFRPQQWSYPLQWKTYEAGEGESWNDFNTVRQLEGLPPEILLIPLIGHTFGHAGVAVQKDNNQWLFYTGDAYFYHKEMNVDSPECTPGLELYQTMMEKNRKARLWNQTRLRELKKTKGDAIEIFCAHDLVEFERLAGQPYNNPVRQMQRSSSSDHASYLS